MPVATNDQVNWHALEAAEILRRLQTDEAGGLRSDEAARRLQTYGRNVVASRKGHGPLVRFLLQFHQPLLYILLAAGIITALLGEHVDSGVIFAVVLVNAIVGYIQESKALRAIEALAKTLSVGATVIRDGDRRRISAAELVPGDIVLLESGAKVPADLRLLDLRELAIDESLLTGESVPIEKSKATLPLETELADRTNMAYSSTLVTRGHGIGVVVATGDATEVGRISKLIGAAEELQTPLLRKIASFSRLLLWVILGIAAAAFVIGLLRGQSVVDMFLVAVALAVGAIPEGLPAAMTVMLAMGVSRMARRKAIIRRLPAVEALGSTTVICSDKTGTLTQNQMTVRAIAVAGEMFEVSGSGYDPTGVIERDGQAIDVKSHKALELCLRAGALCNDASLSRIDGSWEIQGDPTEAALLVAAHKAGLRQPELQEKYPRLDVIAFESDRQYMATLHVGGAPDQPCLVFVKGSVERVSAMCDRWLLPDGRVVELDRSSVQQSSVQLASRGLRVLALAYKEVPPGTEDLSHDMIRNGLIFLGIQGMLDPPRPEAITAVAKCRNAGILVKMITGDHALTAASIAAMIGLVDGGRDRNAHDVPVLTGAQMAKIPDHALPEAAEDTAVFARMTPEQKLRLVKALQSRRHIVAMTGDGVNDAPALRQADIGVAMGVAGTEVAKESADMVLADDNFASIEAAVEEGRTVFDNLTKFIVWTLPTNIGEGTIILASVLLGTALPILPLHALYVNMVTTILLGLPLVFEKKEAGIMDRPPRDPRKPILTYELIMRTGLVSLLLLAGGFGLFTWEVWRGTDEAAARSAAVSAVVFGEMFYLLNCRSIIHSMFHVGVFSNPWIWLGVASMAAVQWCFAHLTIFNRLFHTEPMSLETWLLVIGVGVAIYVIVGVEKWLRRLAGER
nr:hypothetical protein [uncultured bacterium]